MTTGNINQAKETKIMQTITTIFTDTHKLVRLQVPQYPITTNSMGQLIKTHTINSAGVLSSVAHDIEDKVNNQRELFIDIVDKYFPMDSLTSRDNKVTELMHCYFSSYYDTDVRTKIPRDITTLADGYMTVLSSFTHYHAQRLGERHNFLQCLLLANRIDPVCQPLYLSLDTGKLYMLDDNYSNTFEYNKAHVRIIDITKEVLNLLKEYGYISEDTHTLEEWYRKVIEADDTILISDCLGKLLALALFQYTTNDCFVVNYV